MIIPIKYYPQYKDYSCGPVSLRMVFEYLGKHYSEAKMIALCKAMPKRGTSHRHMIEAVNKSGLNYEERLNGKIKDLIKLIDLKCPVIINYYNPSFKSGHYSVVRGYDRKKRTIIMADPANGRSYMLSWSKFKRLWHNSNNTSKGWFLIIKRKI